MQRQRFFGQTNKQNILDSLKLRRASIWNRKKGFRYNHLNFGKNMEIWWPWGGRRRGPRRLRRVGSGKWNGRRIWRKSRRPGGLLKTISLLTLCVGAKNVEVSDGEQGMGRGRGLQEVMRRRLQVLGAGRRQWGGGWLGSDASGPCSNIKKI